MHHRIWQVKLKPHIGIIKKQFREYTSKTLKIAKITIKGNRTLFLVMKKDIKVFLVIDMHDFVHHFSTECRSPYTAADLQMSEREFFNERLSFVLRFHALEEAWKKAKLSEEERGR